MQRCHTLRSVAAILVCLSAGSLVAETVQVRFPGPLRMEIVEREVPPGESPLEVAVQAVIAGPTPEEQAAGLTTDIPSGVDLVGLAIVGDSAEIDLSDEILSGLDESSLRSVFLQFSATIGGFPEIRSIRLTCRGQLLADYLPPTKVDFDVNPPPLDPRAIPGGIGPDAVQGLDGLNITIGPSHGRYWNGSAWYWQRSDPCGLGEAVLEDTNSVRLMQFLYQYLTQDGASVHVPRELNESNCCHSGTGLHWWKMAARYWLQANGLPSSVWDSSTTDLNDDIRARPLFADYRGSHIYISHHTNGAAGTGTETYRDTAMEYPAHEANSLNLANNVHNNIISAVRDMYDSGWTSRGVKDAAGGFGEIRIPNRPAILIELAFHDRCDKDAQYLIDNFFRSVTQWGIYKGVCDYFGRSPTWDKYSCELVSNTIPSSMEINKTYSVNIVYRNRGVLWSNGRDFRLGAVGDSDPFAAGRHNISGEVRPGSTYTFSFTMTAPATPGTYTTDWRMVRDGVAWFGPTLTKQVTVTGVPTITAHPANRNVCAGENTTFSVTATGSGTLSYRWQRNNTDLSDGGKFSGTGTAKLTVSNVDATVTGDYRCRVTNSAGSVNSNSASLTLKTATAFTTHPANQSKCAGESAAFTVAASGDGTVSYQWQKDGNNLSNGGHYSGATTATLTVANIEPNDVASYRCIATAGCGSATSNNATLSLKTATSITSHPEARSRCPGQSATFSVTAAGDGTLSYQWQKNTSNLGNGGHYSGVTTATLTVSDIDAADEAAYRCVVTAGCGSAVSNAADLTLKAATVVTQHPEPQEICEGGVAGFAVAAVGEGEVSYQWQKDSADLADGGSIAGAQTATLAIDPVQEGDGGVYRCVVTAGCGSATSQGATLTFQQEAGIAAGPTSLELCPGAEATFAVTPSGSGPFHFIWLKSNAPIDGAPDAATYVIAAVSPEDEGDYRVEVTGPCGPPVLSDAASLVVLEDTSIEADPTPLALCPGEPALFTAQAAGTGPFHYTWLKNSEPISGAPDEPALSIPAVNQSHSGDYSVRVQGACGGPVTSAVANLAVNQAPVIVQGQIASLVVDTGSTCPSQANEVQLSATDHEGDPLTWRVKAGSEPTKGIVSFVDGAGGNSVRICYQPTVAMGWETFAIEVVDACGQTAVATIDVAIFDLSTVLSWQSVQQRGAAGEWVISLDPNKTDADTGSAGPVVEPAVYGLRLIRIEFEEPVMPDDGQLGGNDVVITGSDGTLPPTSYVPTSVALVNGNRVLEVRFDPAAGERFSPLPDGRRYTIDVTGKFVGLWTGLLVGGDANCQVRALAGDVSGDGEVNLADLGLVAANLHEALATANALCDLNLDGRINLIDLAIAKSRQDQTAP